VKDLLFIVMAVVAYFFVACAGNRLYKWMFPPQSENSSSVRESIMVISVLMTIFSLGAVVLLNRPLLAIPGVYVGLILSTVLGGGRHGPADPYSWSLFAAPTNFFLYYWIVQAVAKRFPRLF